MIKRWLKFIKESGIIGSLIAAAIIASLSIIIPYLGYYISFFNKKISISLEISHLVSFFFVLIGIILFIFIWLTNITRKVGKYKGYYRNYLKVIFYPYLRNIDNKYFTHREWIMEYTMYKRGITTIGPYTYYAYRPRSIEGEEKIYNFSYEVRVNDSQSNIVCEETDLSTDGKRLLLRSKIPLNAGDKVYFKLQYDVFGENAISQDELDDYLLKPDLKNDTRNNIFKKIKCEAVFMNPAYAKEYQIKVFFPQNYPWNPLDNLDDQVDIILGLSPLSKDRLRKIVKLKINENSIILKYKHKFPPA